MLYVFQYDIAAVALCSIILLMQLLKHGFPTASSKLFDTLIIMTMVAAIFDAITAYGISYPAAFSVPVHYLLNIIYYVAQNLSIVVYSLFLITTVSRQKHVRRRYIWFLNAVAFIQCLLIISDPATGFIFRIAGDGSYSHGPLYLVLHIIVIAVIIVTVPVVIAGRESLMRYQRISIYLFLVGPVIGMIYQLINPYILAASFISMLLILFNYLALENPDFYRTPGADCFNGNALEAYINEQLLKHFSFSVIAISFGDRLFNSSLSGSEVMEYLVNPSVKKLQDIFGYGNVFYMGNNRYVVAITHQGSRLLRRKSVESDEVAVEKIREVFKPGHRVGRERISLRPSLCIIRYPDNYNDAQNFTVILNAFFNEHSKVADTNSVTSASDDAIVSRIREQHVIQAMRTALNNRSFVYYFQPILDVHSGSFRSAEVLLRLEDATLGQIAPSEFINVAEHNGLITELGIMMFDRVCGFLSQHRDELKGVDYIEYNLSIPHPLADNFADEYLAIIEKHCLAPSYFNFEVTEECAATADKGKLLMNLQRFVDAGITISMDDFGTGYSNMTNITDMPFNLIKLDKSLLWKAMQFEDSYVVFRDNIAMLKEIGKEILVEGVEDGEMADLSVKLGCDYIQGFYYSAPISPSAYLAFLEANNG